MSAVGRALCQDSPNRPDTEIALANGHLEPPLLLGAGSSLTAHLIASGALGLAWIAKHDTELDPFGQGPEKIDDKTLDPLCLVQAQ